MNITDEIVTIFRERIATVGRPKILDLMAEYGVKQASHIPEEKASEFMEKLKELK